MTEYDYKDRPKPGDNILMRLGALAEQQVKAENKVTESDDLLKEAKEALRAIKEDALPQLMDEAGVEEVTTTGGIKISVATAIRASIPKSNPGEAFMWLKANGHGGLISQTAEVSFGDDEAFAGFDCAMKELGVQFREKKGVHPSTLKSFVTEMLREGVDIPLGPFGIFRQRFAKVERP